MRGERGLVDTALTRASRRLQKRPQPPRRLPSPWTGRGIWNWTGRGRKRGSNGEARVMQRSSGQGEGSSEGGGRKNYSVAEVADAGEDHREAVLVGGGDNLLVASRTARLRDCGRSRFGGERRAVGERKEGFGGEHGAFEGNAETSRLFAGSVNGIDAGSGTATNRERTILGYESDRVRLDVLGDADTEGECSHLGVGGNAFRHDLTLTRILDTQIGGLHQESAHDLFEVEFGAPHGLRMEPHHTPIPLLAQELEHTRTEVDTDKHLGEKFVDSARKVHFPRLVGDDDPAEGRIGISGERLIPCAFQRWRDTDTAWSVVLENCDDGLAIIGEFENQVYG